MNPPFLNGSSSPVRLLVPSGKMRNEWPSLQVPGGAFDGRQALVAVAAFERNEPGQIEGSHEHRQLPQLGLVEHAQPRKQLVQDVEDDRRLDVTRMVDRVDGRARVLDPFRLFDADADPGDREAEANTQVTRAIQQAAVAEDQRNEQDWRPGEQDQ